MSVDSILESTSFSALDPAEQATVCQLFDETYEKASQWRLTHKKPINQAISTKELFKGRHLLPVSFAFYSNKLEKTNPATFQFLTKPQIETLEHDLLYAFYILSAQYQLAAELNLDAAESRRQERRALGEHIKRCAQLIHQLREAKAAKTPERQHVLMATDDSKQYLAYLGLVPASLIAKGIDAISTGSSEAVKAWAGEGATVWVKDSRRAINSPRLYWVWAGSWIQTWISLLSDYYTHKQEAQLALSSISPLTGFMSFALYLSNASLEILMVAKHTIRGAWWMSEGELELTAWERFKAHAYLRKYSILNDFVWGLGNMACFFWLVGQGTMGYYGNVATTGLLLMDAVLGYFQYKEASKQHEAELKRYERDISQLNRQIRMAWTLDDRKKLGLQLKTLEAAEVHCQLEWQYKTYGLIKDLSYAVALVLAFTILCSFLLPPALITAEAALILSITGTALCFLSSLMNDAMGGVLDIQKSKKTGFMAKTAVDGLLEAFRKEKDPDLKKLLYLDLKQAHAMIDYQAELLSFQKLGLFHEMFIKLLVPPLIVASFVFLPMGLGVAAVAIGLTLAIASGRLYLRDKPKLAQLAEFNELEYEAFKQLPLNELNTRL